MVHERNTSFHNIKQSYYVQKKYKKKHWFSENIPCISHCFHWSYPNLHRFLFTVISPKWPAAKFHAKSRSGSAARRLKNLSELLTHRCGKIQILRILNNGKFHTYGHFNSYMSIYVVFFHIKILKICMMFCSFWIGLCIEVAVYSILNRTLFGFEICVFFCCVRMWDLYYIDSRCMIVYE